MPPKRDRYDYPPSLTQLLKHSFRSSSHGNVPFSPQTPPTCRLKMAEYSSAIRTHLHRSKSAGRLNIATDVMPTFAAAGFDRKRPTPSHSVSADVQPVNNQRHTVKEWAECDPPETLHLFPRRINAFLPSRLQCFIHSLPTLVTLFTVSRLISPQI